MGVMKKLAIRSVVWAALLTLLVLLGRLLIHNTYTAYIPLSSAESASPQIRIQPDSPDMITYGEARMEPDRVVFPFRPEKPGEFRVNIHGAQDHLYSSRRYRVGRLLTVYDETTGGFTGDILVMIALTLFYLGESALLFHAFRRCRGSSRFYAYSTIYIAGFSLFTLLTGLLLLYVTVRHLLDPLSFVMMNVYRIVASASFNYMVLTSPLVLLFAAALAVSNIELLRHERFRIQNVLGLILSLLMVLGEVVAIIMFTRDRPETGSLRRAMATLENAYATVFIYCECVLFGAMICGTLAARHTPSADREYIIILGCYFRPDGTLSPLLRGRVDKALEFWRRQEAETGLRAKLIPSGGQGANEPISEAEAMARYLRSQGVPEEDILKEEHSVNTLENMAFSRKIISTLSPGARVAYATTNYHVFRSGVWSNRAGLHAEGIGSRTKWWFWPNAFVRECVGLAAHRWKEELLFLGVLLVFFSLLSMALM